MIEELRSAGDQLREAWDNYRQVCSKIDSCITPEWPQPSDFLAELADQLKIEMESISSYELDYSPLSRFFKSLDINARPPSDTFSGPFPINFLPPEILTRIFYLLLAQPCNLHLLSPDNKTHYPIYPDYLAQVCSHWREVAISTCSLWCHIDLSAYEPQYGDLIARAERHIARAGTLPIELHIADNKDERYRSMDRDHSNLFELVSRISSRVTALEFVTEDLLDFHYEVFMRVLLGRPQNFTKFTTWRGHNYSDALILAGSVDPAELDHEFTLFQLNVTEDQIQNCFAPLAVLHLHGLFPYWPSIAYHGLVDLRLLPRNPRTSIQEGQFKTILTSSPGLRILHFGLNIYDSAPENVQIVPVHLPELQVVKIFPNHPLVGVNRCPSKVLRLLAPGMRPLRLSIEDYYIPDAHLTVEMERFFARSRVAKFYTRVVFPPLTLLCQHAAHLELVVLDGFESYSQDEIFFQQSDSSELALHPLNSVHVTRSSLSKSNINLLLESCPDGTVLYSCNFIRDGREDFSTENVLDIFPSVKVSDDNPYSWGTPTADWDLLD
ncbi:F-box-like domain protein [Rhizoctonia solani AG-3 Rhs1AP]|uniref:F-box-like domain protein n=2 Tax=Rhizoctonia solani AG-3 TaxID=1086053 RepID=A0A074S8J0_9AGAM|nr:F-box-like domain protein [Rhizoctonia solani AG-3 Rhs1AP]KEP46337.1 F-box-like domain protein [Rhizoctonia solani 123E]